MEPKIRQLPDTCVVGDLTTVLFMLVLELNSAHR